MKKFKSGFTLAEVLITLGIIGVVAAIVMPSVMSSYQYKTVGVKLAKFASQLEGAARPYVINNENLDEQEDTINGFVQESFIFTNLDQLVDSKGDIDVVSTAPTNFTGDNTGINKELKAGSTTTDKSKTIGATLKDGTIVAFYSLEEKYKGSEGSDSAYFDNRQVGEGVIGVRFAPNVSGLPRNAQQSYDFVVTELGYVYPHQKDACLIEISGKDYNTNRTTYSSKNCSYSENNGS